jgi:hypothetical protein
MSKPNERLKEVLEWTKTVDENGCGKFVISLPNIEGVPVCGYAPGKMGAVIMESPREKRLEQRCQTYGLKIGKLPLPDVYVLCGNSGTDDDCTKKMLLGLDAVEDYLNEVEKAALACDDDSELTKEEIESMPKELRDIYETEGKPPDTDDEE